MKVSIPMLASLLYAATSLALPVAKPDGTVVARAQPSETTPVLWPRPAHAKREDADSLANNDEGWQDEQPAAKRDVEALDADAEEEELEKRDAEEAGEQEWEDVAKRDVDAEAEEEELEVRSFSKRQQTGPGSPLTQGQQLKQFVLNDPTLRQEILNQAGPQRITFLQQVPDALWDQIAALPDAQFEQVMDNLVFKGQLPNLSGGTPQPGNPGNGVGGPIQQPSPVQPSPVQPGQPGAGQPGNGFQPIQPGPGNGQPGSGPINQGPVQPGTGPIAPGPVQPGSGQIPGGVPNTPPNNGFPGN
ncbi:hypothetical protein ABW21_db0208811 [Orbilia brochopaga]|nr:hypothetical protein ABW21_db0208811 [Drechslerella brochopaga]